MEKTLMFGKVIRDEKKDVSERKWIAWLAAEFARIAEWYRAVPYSYGQNGNKTYVDGAEIDFAKMALSNLNELKELDTDAYDMVVDSWSYVIAQMQNTLKGQEG